MHKRLSSKKPPFIDCITWFRARILAWARLSSVPCLMIGHTNEAWLRTFQLDMLRNQVQIIVQGPLVRSLSVHVVSQSLALLSRSVGGVEWEE